MQERQDSISEEEQDVWSGEEDAWIEDEDKIRHDRGCRLPMRRLYRYDDMTICLHCSAKAGPAIHGRAHRIFGRISRNTELRLLLVKQSTLDQDMHCQLIPGKIGWAEKSGDASETKRIYLNDLPFRVTANCERALKRVRLDSQARITWIDAVCIDQKDDEEGGEPTADELEGRPYIRRGQEVLDLFCQQSEENSKVMQIAIRSLFSRRYFSRVFLQEWLSRRRLVLYGEYQISAGTGIHLSFLPLLDLARGSEATDPRDKVFAVFGMINLAEQLGYVLDYTEAVKDTYRRATVLGRRLHRLPSWVTDWSCSYSPIPTIEASKDFFSTVLLDKERPEIEFVGAQVSHLRSLLHVGFRAEVFLPGEGSAGYAEVKTSDDLKILHQRLGLAPDDTLWVYMMLQSQDCQACSSVDDFEKKLALHSTNPVKKRDVVHAQNEVFILSGGHDFSFRGACVLGQTMSMPIEECFYQPMERVLREMMEQLRRLEEMLKRQQGSLTWSRRMLHRDAGEEGNCADLEKQKRRTAGKRERGVDISACGNARVSGTGDGVGWVGGTATDGTGGRDVEGVEKGVGGKRSRENGGNYTNGKQSILCPTGSG
ncbi:hypothetical protein F5884DRAFT_900283 [Xylogone sp. PMI_703]|nr:hypothetical protein F5884DRAFT_900283 [Xylogone sp. PMI_703]